MRRPSLLLALLSAGAMLPGLADGAHAASGGSDPSFNGSGYVVSTVPRDALGAAVSPVDGSIVAVGRTGSDAIVTRFTSSGALDTTFDSTGSLVVDLGGTADLAVAAHVLPDGSTLVAAEGQDGARRGLALLKIDPTGVLDTSFGGGDGIARAKFRYGDADAYGLLVDGHGRASIVGSATDGAVDRFAVARFLPDGTLDSSFGRRGMVTVPFHDGGVALTATSGLHGSIFVGGYADASSGWRMAVAKLTARGDLDFTFSTDGRAVIGVSGLYVAAETAFPNGKLLIGGPAQDAIATARFRPDGSLDPHFRGGRQHIVVLPSGDSIPTPDGMEFGSARDDGTMDFAGWGFNSAIVVQVTPNGALDQGFGTGGEAWTDEIPDDPFFQGWGVAIQPDAEPVWTGTDGTHMVLARFLAG